MSWCDIQSENLLWKSVVIIRKTVVDVTSQSLERLLLEFLDLLPQQNVGLIGREQGDSLQVSIFLLAYVQPIHACNIVLQLYYVIGDLLHFIRRHLVLSNRSMKVTY